MLGSLAKQSAIYGVSTVVGRLLSYLLTPYYTRVFAPEQFGVITDIYSIIPLLLVILTMGMESSYFRFAAKAEAAGGDVELSKRTLFGTTWGVTSLFTALFFGVALLFRGQISSVMGADYAQNHIFIVLLAAIVSFDVWSAIPFARLRQEGRAKLYVVVKLVNIILQVGLAIAFGALGLFSSELGVGWVLVANLIASVATFALLIAVDFKRVTLKIDKGLLSAILVYSLPLLLSGIAGTASDFIDRQMIKYLIPEGGMAQLGIYGAIVKIAVVMTLFTQMYRLAAEPFFLSNFKKEEFKAMNAAAMRYFILFSILIFLVITLFSDIFAHIVGSSFREGLHILPVVLIANILAGVWLNLSFWYKREERTQFALYVTLVGLLAAIIANILLVPRMGYLGAAWARLIAEAVMVMVSYLFNRRYFPTPYNLPRIGEYIIFGATIYGLHCLVSSWLNDGCAVGFAANALLLLLAIFYAIRREQIDVRRLVKRVLKLR